MKYDYVVGFLFNKKKDSVVLISKTKPEWQKGKLNGVGGKIEGDETPQEAMRREFKEETDADVNNWRSFVKMKHRGSFIYFFVAFENKNVETTTEEIVAWYELDEVHPDYSNVCVSNLKWLLPLALSEDKVTAKVDDPS